MDANYQKDTLYDIQNQGNVFKIRYEDAAYSVVFTDIKYHGNSVSGKKVIRDEIVQLDAYASDTLCVYIFDNTGTNLLYYKALSGNQLDLNGIPTGEYKIAVANEHFDTTSDRPTKSSQISSMKSLEIVAPHQISYNKQPQSGASAGKDYEFSKNVNASQKVGEVNVISLGAHPLTYTLETNGGDNTYKNFEIDGLNSGASSSTSLDVKIKSNAPDLVNGGLKAGTYRFCINAVSYTHLRAHET